MARVRKPNHTVYYGAADWRVNVYVLAKTIEQCKDLKSNWGRDMKATAKRIIEDTVAEAGVRKYGPLFNNGVRPNFDLMVFDPHVSRDSAARSSDEVKNQYVFIFKAPFEEPFQLQDILTEAIVTAAENGDEDAQRKVIEHLMDKKAHRLLVLEHLPEWPTWRYVDSVIMKDRNV